MSTDVTIMKTLVRQDQVTGSRPLEETFRVEKKRHCESSLKNKLWLGDLIIFHILEMILNKPRASDILWWTGYKAVFSLGLLIYLSLAGYTYENSNKKWLSMV